MLRRKHPSVLTRAITVSGSEELISLKNILIEIFYKFQPTRALAARSKNAEYLHIRIRLISSHRNHYKRENVLILIAIQLVLAVHSNNYKYLLIRKRLILAVALTL